MVEKYEGVTVCTKANLYFDGKVQSRSIFFPDGTRKTLGVIMPGEYEFGTGDREIMDVVAGKAEVLLPGKDEWEAFEPGVSFSVPAQSKFKIRCSEITEYVCSYFKNSVQQI